MKKLASVFGCAAMFVALAAAVPHSFALVGDSGIQSTFPIPLPLRSIAGETISSSTGQPVGGVKVRLTGNGTSQSQRSDGNGQFLFAGLAPGSYVIQAGGGLPRKVNVGGYDVFITLHVD